jgi:hypothetical protein
MIAALGISKAIERIPLDSPWGSSKFIVATAIDSPWGSSWSEIRSNLISLPYFIIRYFDI